MCVMLTFKCINQKISVTFVVLKSNCGRKLIISELSKHNYVLYILLIFTILINNTTYTCYIQSS